MSDERLEQLLREHVNADVHTPTNLGSITIQRLRATSTPPKSKRRLSRIGKNIGIVVAASLLIMVGAVSTWAAMIWLPGNNPQQPGEEDIGIDLSSHPKVIEVQEDLPFELALPTWLPPGYDLANVELNNPQSPEDLTVFLRLEGPQGKEPITIRQGYKIEQIIPEMGSSQQNVNYRQPASELMKNMGYYWEREIQGSVIERSLTIITQFREPPGNQTFATIYSGSPVTQSYVPDTIVDTQVYLDLAQSIVGVDVSLVPPQQQMEELMHNFTMVHPNEIPPGYQKAATGIKASLFEATSYSSNLTSTLTYSSNEDSFEIRQWQSQHPPQHPAGKEIPLYTSQPALPSYYENTQNTISAYYYSHGPVQKLSFTIEDLGLYNFEVSTESNHLDQQALTTIAQSLSGQYNSTPCPTKEKTRLYVEPTTFKLSFGPTGDKFVNYLPANNTVARLWIRDNSYDLPGLVLGEYGPVWWRGEKFVYHVQSRGVDPGQQNSNVFFVYDSSDHSYTEIRSPFVTEEILQPVLLDDETVAVVADDGTWQYNLPTGDWELVLSHKIDLKEAYWSPDTAKVAYTTQGDSEELIIVDAQTGAETVAYSADSEEILDVAWSSNGDKLAFVTSSPQGFIWQSEELKELPSLTNNHFKGSLGWVPHQDKISFFDQFGMVLLGIDDNQWFSLHDCSNYAWLDNGNLAIIGDVVTDEQGESAQQIIIYSWQ